ncbi:helix-turn-helix transcriptional regulator [Sulfurospirillum sp. T05]|uniref:Helix-turn-helix transcriptional regulator n=1 Tax=Sulfurospirillum tamanense TaxID=2813362 RepID=A0ABS2WRQ3_9BACT|nr:helix-turn-helix transcriptional regulator [Sulfurospirillum tamanensis]MBN2964185.1 helix-turn-helix transcriptional regulator [Sulfurospirillum tamanensis]
MHTYDEPVYLISVVAKVLSIHPQTLRQYEREGLVLPSRTDGKMRLYSQRDIDRIKMILRLTRDLGVNLAGVDVVLQLKEKIDEYEVLIEELRVEVSKVSQRGTVPPQNSLVKRKNTYEIILFGE